jgi:hypothetical protein
MRAMCLTCYLSLALGATLLGKAPLAGDVWWIFEELKDSWGPLAWSSSTEIQELY